jgi:hypothetical protein
MTPSEIKDLLKKQMPSVKFEPRKNGWAFYYTDVIKGGNPTRIGRALQCSPSAKTEFKLAATSRLKGDTFVDVSTPNEVLAHIANEIAVLKQHFHPYAAMNYRPNKVFNAASFQEAERSLPSLTRAQKALLAQRFVCLLGCIKAANP